MEQLQAASFQFCNFQVQERLLNLQRWYLILRYMIRPNIYLTASQLLQYLTTELHLHEAHVVSLGKQLCDDAV